MQYGQCQAITGEREPVPCTRWAVSEHGWCWQHYASELERVKREERIAIRKAALDARIDAFIAKTQREYEEYGRRRKRKPFRLEAPA